jgi:hypothetical protein
MGISSCLILVRYFTTSTSISLHLPFSGFGMLFLCHRSLTDHFSVVTIISCFRLHQTFLQQYSCLFFLVCLSVSTLVWNHNFFIFLDESYVDLEHSYLGFVILYNSNWWRNTNSHSELGRDVYYTAVNTEIFTGILSEKEQCYSMSF